MPHKFNPLLHAIKITTKAEGLNINVETSNLIIRSLHAGDEEDCFTLFRNPVVMQRYANGEPYDEKKIQDKFKGWTNRWINHDPFSVYSVIEKNSDEFIGVIGIGHASPGKSDTFYAMLPQHWGKKYGNEMVSALIQSLIPRLMFRGYLCEHRPLRGLEADTHLGNIASQRILKNVGFKDKGRIDKFDMSRVFLEVRAEKLKSDYHRFFAKRDRKKHLREERRHLNDEVDITVEEMAKSVFGRSNGSS